MIGVHGKDLMDILTFCYILCMSMVKIDVIRLTEDSKEFCFIRCGRIHLVIVSKIKSERTYAQGH